MIRILQPTTYNLRPNRGFGVIEIVVSITVISLSLFATMTVARTSLELNRRVFLSTQGGFLLEEGSEGLRMLRDISWSNVSSMATSTPYYLNFSTSTNAWSATTTSSMIDGFFKRTIVPSGVYRDSNDDIAGSGTLDPGTKKFTINVSWWNGVATTTRSLVLYLTNLL